MLQALSFLTILGRGTSPRPGSLLYFPIVGVLIGLAVGYAWWGAAHVWAAPVAAGVALAVDAALTGMLHLDGLSDSADGLLPPMDRARRLAVMHDPAVGAFGAVTLIIVLLLRFSALASSAPAPLAVAAVWCVSRTAMAVIALSMRYARADGLVSAFLGARSRVALTASVLLGVVISVPLALLEPRWWGLLVLGCAAAGSWLVAAFARARIGGFTGDVLGAAGVLGETAGLLALAAVPGV